MVQQQASRGGALHPRFARACWAGVCAPFVAECKGASAHLVAFLGTGTMRTSTRMVREFEGPGSRVVHSKKKKCGECGGGSSTVDSGCGCARVRRDAQQSACAIKSVDRMLVGRHEPAGSTTTCASASARHSANHANKCTGGQPGRGGQEGRAHPQAHYAVVRMLGRL